MLPITSAKPNESSELKDLAESSGKSQNLVSTFYRYHLSNTAYLVTSIIISICLKGDLHSENC